MYNIYVHVCIFNIISLPCVYSSSVLDFLMFMLYHMSHDYSCTIVVMHDLYKDVHYATVKL